MAKPKSSVSRGEYKKQWRQKNTKDKRFNKPLNQYLKLKYENIYDEYCMFYKSLDEANPTAKDLTKTAAFKKWKKNLKGNENEVDEPVKLNTYILKQHLDPEKNQGDEPITFVAATQELLPADEPTQLDTFAAATQELLSADEPTQPDTFSAAVEDLFSQNTNREEINIEFQQAHDIIAGIINDLEQEAAVRGLLNEVVHNNELDEGIGLNLEDEIEPFDFYLEADFDF